MSRFLTAVAAALLIGIGWPVSAGAINNPPKIGLVQIDLSNPFHVGEVEGAKEAARRYGFDLRRHQRRRRRQQADPGFRKSHQREGRRDRGQLHRRRRLRPGDGEGEGGGHPDRLPAQQDRGLRERARLRRALIPARSSANTPCNCWRRRTAERQGRGGQPPRSARPGPQHRPQRRLHRRHLEISRHQGRGAGADRLGSDQGGADHRKLADRLSQLSTSSTATATASRSQRARSSSAQRSAGTSCSSPSTAAKEASMRSRAAC